MTRGCAPIRRRFALRCVTAVRRSVGTLWLLTSSYSSREEFARTPVGPLKFAALSAGAAEGGGGVPSDDDADYPNGAYLKKGKQDPMSHRIIEKRRRDRMNNCLADLSRLIPPEYLKKGRGRVEKTEIIEMAIRHLKYLGERVEAADRRTGAESFRAGWHECAAEAVQYLTDVRGFSAADGLCVQLAVHLQRRGDHLIKGEYASEKRSNVTNGMAGSSSSEATSSSSSSKSYPKNGGTAAHQPELANEGPAYDHLEVDPVPRATPAPAPFDGPYPMDCDRNYSVRSTDGVQSYDVKYWIGNGEIADPPAAAGAAAPAPARALRAVRRPDLLHADDYMHSYKFKNCIERRFSRSQDNEAHDMSLRHVHPHSKAYLHKRRRAAPKHAPASTSTSTSASGSTEEVRENSPQDSSDSPHRHYTPKPTPPAANHSGLTPNHYVPVFALNALGKYYVPLSVEYACLARQLGPYNMLESRAAHVAAPLHPVTIHVNFQPCLNYHMKRESNENDWNPT
ncbi:Transcription factor cwo [Eumeta japonica]|uniref:Transcription factor cwo n=1 Tax=Eumeta variegata TaxID=151549 RepID=A0A4C1YUX1_EUMVA|nr:Transcription factor cwo [Eumeta japonica]